MYRHKAVLLAVLSLPLVLASAPAPAQTTSYRYTLSSGPFLIPPGAKSVDWAAVNSSAVSRNIRVTVYKHGIGVPRVTVAPGALTMTLAPNTATHNANSVGSVFFQGFYYEVVLETNSLRVLPLLNIWSGFGAEVMPGTSIPAGSWVRSR